MADVLVQRVDSGDPTPFLLDASLISNRQLISVPIPPATPCLQIMDDALAPGRYILVGWSNAQPTTAK